MRVQEERFNEIWCANRKRQRKTLTGTRLALDPDTGFLNPVGRDGFTSEDRAAFVERLRICSNITQVCKSIPIDVQSFYDAVAVDQGFRKAVNEACNIPGRAKQLNEGMKAIKHQEKTDVVNELFKAAEKYLGK